MISHRSRGWAVAGLLATLLVALVPGLPAWAADSPEAAAEALLDLVDAGDFGSIEGVVCEAERDAVRELFDLGASLGLPDVEDGGIPLDFRVEDRAVEVVAQVEESASVRIAATLTVDVDEDRVRELVRSMLEAEGQPVREEDLDLMVPFMTSALSQGQRVDEEVEVVLEDGEWLVCGGLGSLDDPAEEVAPEPSISFAGLCGLVSLAEVNALGPEWLQYASTQGFEGNCTYSTVSADEFRTLSLNLGRGGLEEYQAFYPDGLETSVAGRPAYQVNEQLFVELGDDVLAVSVYAGEDVPEGFDAGAYLVSIGELIAPLVASLEIAEATSEAVVEAAAWPDPAGPSLCEAASVDELTQLAGAAFAEAIGDGASCTYSSAANQESYQLVLTNLVAMSFDDLQAFFPDGEELEVGGLPAYREAGQVWVRLPGEDRLLQVGVYAATMSGEELDTDELARSIAELVAPRVDDGS